MKLCQASMKTSRLGDVQRESCCLTTNTSSPGRLPVYTAKCLFLDTLFDHARLQEADDRFDVGTAFQCTCVDEVFRVASGLVGYIARGNDLADIPTYQYIISILLPLQSDS